MTPDTAAELARILRLPDPPPALTLASACAFALGELADWSVYQPLRSRGLAVAMLLAGVAGSVVDSAAFLSLAFGSLAYLPAQVVGKAWMSLAAAAVLGARGPRPA